MSQRPKKRAMDPTSSSVGSKSDEPPETTVADKLIISMKEVGDVTFLVGEAEEKIKASSFVLSAMSTVFKAMFSENWNAKSKTVAIPDIDPKIFDIFLKLMITENLTTRDIRKCNLTVEQVLHLLYVAKKYDGESIATCCREIIYDMMVMQNVASIYECLESLDELDLQQKILYYIDKNADRFFNSKEFPSTSREFLSTVLKRNQLRVEEIDIFHAMNKWAKTALTEEGKEVSGQKIREFLGGLFSLIRFPLILPKDLVLEVGPTGILNETELLRLHEYHSLPKYETSFSTIQMKLTALGFTTWRREPATVHSNLAAKPDSGTALLNLEPSQSISKSGSSWANLVRSSSLVGRPTSPPRTWTSFKCSL